MEAEKTKVNDDSRQIPAIFAGNRETSRLPRFSASKIHPLVGLAECGWQGKIARGKFGATTMNLDDIQLLFEYDRWANNRVLQASSALTAEKLTRDLGGSLRSVRDTLLHIIGSEWAWLTYWKEASPTAAFLNDLWPRADVLFSPDAVPDFTAVRLKWTEVEREQGEFANRVEEESLRRMLPVLETQLSLAHLMQHLANHSSYHRGQIALMMRQLTAEPVATDFALFLMEGRREVSPGRSAAGK
jgi:uncharacterized damage-inducible protein DinB